MTFTIKEKEQLKEALHLYIQETASHYDFIKDLDIPFSSDFEKNMQRLIKRQKKPMYYMFNTTVKKVACIIVTILIVLTSTVLSVDALRQRVKNFVIETFEKFSILTFDDNSNTMGEIKEYYSPSYIPKGYVILEEKQGEIDNIILYKNNNAYEIHFTQMCLNRQPHIDTEDCIIEEIDKYLLIQKENSNRKTIYFCDENYCYEIISFGDLTKEELLKMAKSLESEK